MHNYYQSLDLVLDFLYNHIIYSNFVFYSFIVSSYIHLLPRPPDIYLHCKALLAALYVWKVLYK